MSASTLEAAVCPLFGCGRCWYLGRSTFLYCWMHLKRCLLGPQNRPMATNSDGHIICAAVCDLTPLHYDLD